MFGSMQVEWMAAEPTPEQISRHLEAYLLWLFGWVMFCTSHGDTVDARWIPYARAIADGEEGPALSWGSAVLAATYRALCESCVRTKSTSTLTGMPLLLQLWSFERFPVGRPYVDAGPRYGVDMVGGTSLVDWPTMGSLWTRRRVRFRIQNYVSFFIHN